jgi:hypothetical protein
MPKPDHWWISPHFRQGDFPGGPSRDQKIAIFADRIRGWMLDPAERLLHLDPHSGFAVLAILGTYFEMIAKYQDGRMAVGESGRYFRDGVRDVLSTLDSPPQVSDDVADLLYRGLRNGLYYGGFPTTAIAVNGGLPAVLQYDASGPVVTLNPSQVLLAIQRHFSQYISRLSNVAEDTLRDRFQDRFDSEHA